ncbi:hypothetical protein BSU00_02695 [Tenacibaculum sp. SG-28]|nr:hypothetical protein BSU00_02695 [Tenacibaculum sp. SG-28]
MFGSFLIGYLSSWYYYKKRYQSKLEKSADAIQELKNDMQFSIRARKTIERGGVEIKKPKQLNFERIGTATEEGKNDLTQINGIGSFVETKLNSIGIFTFYQLTQLNDEDIEIVTDLIQFFPGRIQRDKWREQAKNYVKSADEEEIEI